jgi:hypothetical protein
VVLVVGQKPAQHLIGGPRHRCHGRDPEPLVDLRPPWVVDPGAHPLDLERLAGDAGDQDVGVVAVGDRSEGVGLLHAGLAQRVVVEAHPDDAVAAV